MAVAFGREARMHKRAQRPRSAMDGPQRTRRTALDEQYEYLANQLTKQRVLDREGAAGSHLDDLADMVKAMPFRQRLVIVDVAPHP